MSDGATTTAAAAEISRESIGRVDSTGQLEDVLALPEQLRDALWRAESAIMQDWDTPAGLVVAGMGGSAIGGALAPPPPAGPAPPPLFPSRPHRPPTPAPPRATGPGPPSSGG